MNTKVQFGSTKKGNRQREYQYIKIILSILYTSIKVEVKILKNDEIQVFQRYNIRSSTFMMKTTNTFLANYLQCLLNLVTPIDIIPDFVLAILIVHKLRREFCKSQRFSAPLGQDRGPSHALAIGITQSITAARMTKLQQEKLRLEYTRYLNSGVMKNTVHIEMRL